MNIQIKRKKIEGIPSSSFSRTTTDHRSLSSSLPYLLPALSRWQNLEQRLDCQGLYSGFHGEWLAEGKREAFGVLVICYFSMWVVVIQVCWPWDNLSSFTHFSLCMLHTSIDGLIKIFFKFYEELSFYLVNYISACILDLVYMFISPFPTSYHSQDE